MSPWIINFLLLVISCHQSRVGARKARQLACPRFMSVVRWCYHFSCTFFFKTFSLIILGGWVRFAPCSSWLLYCNQVWRNIDPLHSCPLLRSKIEFITKSRAKREWKKKTDKRDPHRRSPQRRFYNKPSLYGPRFHYIPIHLVPRPILLRKIL